MLLRPRIEPLPIPGILLGVYPERQVSPDAARDSLWRTLREYLPSLAGNTDRQAFAQEVAVRREVLEPLSDASLQIVTDAVRKLLFSDGCEGGLQAEAMACAAEAARRVLGWVPYHTQIIAARLLLENRLAQMHTGEGKSFAIALAASVAAMAGIPVHCVTANEYLVKRDAEHFQAFYERLGLTVGATRQGELPEARRAAYACAVTYCTAKELAFDYLKDGLQRGFARHDLRQRIGMLTADEGTWQAPLMRGLCMALVDEADSVLIDEAGTPLILARARHSSTEAARLQQAMRIARNFKPERHYRIEGGRAELTQEARGLLDRMNDVFALGGPDARHRTELVTQALQALHVLVRDRHYVVRDEKVQIIDQTTGRLAEGRAWSRGLHQLIEIKEGCPLTGRQEPMAQITYQRFFPRYLRLAGTSGTLFEARAELLTDYGLRIAAVPLRTPSRRQWLGLALHANSMAKWRAVVAGVQRFHATGQPVLIGTDSVVDSEHLSALLRDAQLEHQVLNARQDEVEADIVARAGRRRAITVATNMAGRGTDIALEPGVDALGGLHVINCQLNGQARIDRQLHGRAARQGDPGSVESVLSLDEPLLRKWLPVTVRGVISARVPTEQPLRGRLACAIVRFAQWREELVLRAQRRDLIRRDVHNERCLAIGGHRE